MPFIESLSEFLARHCTRPGDYGDDYEPPVRPADAKDGCQQLTPSGAAVFYGAEGTSFREPPENQYERLTMQRRYWAERQRRAVREFEGIKLALLGKRAMYFPDGDPETWGRERMAVLQREAERCRSMVVRLDRDIQATPEHRELVEAEDRRAAAETDAAMRRGEELSELNQMTICRLPGGPND